MIYGTGYRRLGREHEEKLHRLNRRFYQTFFAATRDALAIIGLVTLIAVALFRYKVGGG